MPVPWSDPATWGGQVPLPGAFVTIDRPILLDVDVVVGGLEIVPGGGLVFDRASTRTVTSSGNVVVRGWLRLRPGSPGVSHRLRFADVDEAAFVGGGMEVLEGDVGLWCVGDGVVDLAGSQRTAWVRASQDIERGARHIQLAARPFGWQVGDEVAIAPSGEESFDSYDTSTIRRISGASVELDSVVAHRHPVAPVGRGVTVGPEVMNLTRNVSIEGTPSGRSHVIMMSTRRQRLSYFALRSMGPRQVSGDSTASVQGRYPLHFHMMGDSARGSRVTGAVVRECGSHAFVAHESHGVTFTSCISHDTYDDAYWWDPREDPQSSPPPTNDTSYLGCIASMVRADPPFRGFRLAGFNLGAGSGNRALDCVAVGVQGNVDAAGFVWPEGADSMWEFSRCIAHNNKRHGIFTWQNSVEPHVVRDFVCADNGAAGVAHGAYLNGYLYSDGLLARNHDAAVLLHSNSRADIVQRFVRLHCDGGGVARHAFDVTRHTLEPEYPTQIIGCTFTGQRREAIAMTYGSENGPTTRELFDVVECTSSTPLLRMHDETLPDSVIRVQTGGVAVRATPAGTPGTSRPEWNAVVTPISRFSDEAAGQQTHTFDVRRAAATPAS